MVSVHSAAVRFGGDTAGDDATSGDRLDALAARAGDCTGDTGAALSLALGVAASAPLPGHGETRLLWESLATVAAVDPTVARIVEPHLDAVAILAEVPERPDLAPLDVDPASTWGVFAAEGPGVSLIAEQRHDGWRLSGVKPWCSLGGVLSHALVTAHLADGSRGLFAVALQTGGVSDAGGTWVARGLVGVPSGPLAFEEVLAVPVGGPGWYLERPGFAWGGIGVAAIWWGAAVGVARAVEDTARSREPDQVALMHLGAIDVALWSARCALLAAATTIDAGAVPIGTAATTIDAGARPAAALLAHRTRTVVADAADAVLRRAGRALGPAPLALDDRHAGRVADLGLYLRQHHAERDEVSIGRSVLAGGSAW